MRRNPAFEVDWHTEVGLKDLLPTGLGVCLDLGCEDGNARAVILSKGYEWIGLDAGKETRTSLIGEVHSLPFADRTVSAVVLWQTMEHFAAPWMALYEINRVLKENGVLCGSVSWLEPFHEQSYFGFTYLGLRRLLEIRGFSRIEIQPGIMSFPLMLRSWLRHLAVPGAESIAFTMSKMGYWFFLWPYTKLTRIYHLLKGDKHSSALT